LNVFQWLKVGIAIFLAISKPQIIAEQDLIKTRFEMSNLLTDEMIGLVNNGMELEYEAYVSIIATGVDNKKSVYKERIRRKISFDYLNSNYILQRETGLSSDYKKINDLIDDAKKFEARFRLEPEKFSSLNFFIEIRLVENPLIENKLKMKTSDLWSGYRPSLKFICDQKGDEL
jgi:hypothetical protein